MKKRHIDVSDKKRSVTIQSSVALEYLKEGAIFGKQGTTEKTKKLTKATDKPHHVTEIG